jgi:hypothetical protein
MESGTLTMPDAAGKAGAWEQADSREKDTGKPVGRSGLGPRWEQQRATESAVARRADRRGNRGPVRRPAWDAE